MYESKKKYFYGTGRESQWGSQYQYRFAMLKRSWLRCIRAHCHGLEIQLRIFGIHIVLFRNFFEREESSYDHLSGAFLP